MFCDTTVFGASPIKIELNLASPRFFGALHAKILIIELAAHFKNVLGWLTLT